MQGFEIITGSEELRILGQAIIAFLAGALIGLEREKAGAEAHGGEGETTPPGVRSFGFISLIGALSALLPTYLSNITNIGPSYALLSVLIPTSIALLPVIVITFYTIYKLVIMKESGITTPLALALAYVVGISIGIGLIVEGVGISVFATFMLAAKFRIERLVRVMTYEELLSALQLGIIVFLIGPIFARDVYDPIIGVINFKSLYVFFVIILVLSYLGYVLVKTIGPRALHLFSLFGGLVHSEATVVSVVRLGGKLKLPDTVIACGIIAASTSMIARNFLLVAALSMVSYMLVSLKDVAYIIAGFIPAAIIGYFFIRLYGIAEKDISSSISSEDIGKPISYGIAVKALVIFIAILLVTTYVTLVLGSYGTLVSAVLGGLVSAEAVIFTVFTLLNAGKTSVDVAIASSLLSTSVAALNKLLFAKVAGASRLTLKNSLLGLLLMSLPPLIATMVLMFAY